VNLNRFGNRLNSAAFGAVIHAPTSNYWSQVIVSKADPNTGLGIINAIQPRQSLLTRPDRYHKVKPVAANISLIVIVFAPLPEPAPGLIDRYLVACADANIPALLVLNKTDLLKDNDPILALIAEYQALGYEVMQTQADDLTALTQRLKNETVALLVSLALVKV
jgi:ribosome biogenesis GTPase